MKIFSINGYFKDDKSEFQDYLIAEYNFTPEGWTDEDFFFYGLNEKQILECMENNQNNIIIDFVITTYYVLQDN